MELSSLLSNGSTFDTTKPSYNSTNSTPHGTHHSYPTRHTMTGTTTSGHDSRLKTPPAPYNEKRTDSATPHVTKMSPYSTTPKSVAFELLFPESPQFRARLPMRVQIFPHDTTESIVTTVKNFYGLYAGPGGAKGVSFEDDQGNTLIAQYENLRNNMVVYVRVIEEPSHTPTAYGPPSYHSESPVPLPGYYAGDAHHMLPPQPAQALNYGQPPSRPTSRTSRKRSVSPTGGRGRRSVSASANIPPTKNSRSRSGYKSRGSSAHGSFADIHSDGMNGYSSGDGAPGSVSSKTKSEHLSNPEISLDNIVEGGRRKRAKFESSELPLFAPPQMPAATSNSSVSPARRMDHQRASFPFTHPSQHPFSNPQILQSPQSYSNGFGQPGLYSTPIAEGRRTRGADLYPILRQSIGAPANGNSSGILPTPDPTVGSCMSEEDKDVALQLMRLGELVNISHGRTSASTLDDTFSGHADATSSTGATSDAESESEDELPPTRRQKIEGNPHLGLNSVKRFGKHMDDTLVSQDNTELSGNEAENEDGQDGTFKPEIPEDFLNDLERVIKPKTAKARSLSQTASGAKSVKIDKPGKPNRPAQAVKSKIKSNGATSESKPPISPTSLPSQSRKTSVSSTLNFQHQLGDDEEDLSSKPRCQRCRKSKKGCDRQRPCQRCKDAGLSADQCVSEDEGNGRKGRYGRHMGVPVKKDEIPVSAGFLNSSMTTTSIGAADKSKKRKR